MIFLKALIQKHKEIFVYLVVGFLTTIVNWLSYAVCVEFYNPNIVVANSIAWIMAIIFAYVTNKVFVFKSHNWKMNFIIKESFMFVCARLATGVLEMLAVPFFVWCGLDQTILGIDGMFSKVIVSIVVLVLNYIFSKQIIFRKKD